MELFSLCSPECLRHTSEQARLLQISDLPSRELVPGDLVEMHVGDKVPADIRIIALKTATLRSEQASLTGESVAVLKGTEAVQEDGCELQVRPCNGDMCCHRIRSLCVCSADLAEAVQEDSSELQVSHICCAVFTLLLAVGCGWPVLLRLLGGQAWQLYKQAWVLCALGCAFQHTARFYRLAPGSQGWAKPWLCMQRCQPWGREPSNKSWQVVLGCDGCAQQYS